MSDVTLRIDGNRAVLTGKFGNKLLELSPRLEGMKRWIKTGGYSFEVTPANLERFKATYPDAAIEGEQDASEQFEKWAVEASPVARGRYSPKTAPFPFQGRALALSTGFEPQKWGILAPPGASPAEPGDANPRPLARPSPGDHRSSPAAKLSGWLEWAPLPAYALLGEMGTGKTKILIDTAGALWCAGLIDAVLISAPKGVHAQWIEEQIPEHLGTCVPRQCVAINNMKKIPDWLPGKLHVMAVNVDFPRSAHGYEKCQQFIAQHRGRVLIIIDESHEIKTFTARRTEAWIGLGRACAYRRIATGTPLSKSLMDAFAQYYFLDRNIFGFEYMTTFRSEYCIMGGAEMRDIVGNKNVEQFWGKIANNTFRITKEEADLGLPAKMPPIRFPFDMSPEQKSHYLAMKEDMITRMESGELVDAKNIMTQLIRLQQITCGFLTNSDKTEYLSNARIEALKSILLKREGKCVIWARFNEDIKAIKLELGDEAVTYWGGTSNADRVTAKARFLDVNDPVRFFVANPAAGGTGLNLQGECRTVIYYSNSFDAIDRWQSEDRVHRFGANWPITYFDIVARGTIDYKILSNLRAKKSISDLAFDDIRQILLAA